ncbi:putative glycoside hydrolase [Marinimicrobium locisalis]|uniref:putative glycoside hydrolase n=1 Tax=Marinimicrobium locisalis TaxID=546022 RepID=UPI0032219A36
MTQLNLWGCLALLLLVGCGGGSGSTPDEETPAPENTAPSANAGAAATVAGGTVIPLDGSASSDEDGDELTYAWSLDAAATAYFLAEDGTLTETLESATGKLLIPASQAGEDITVSLEVSDGTETASDTVTYSVEPCTEQSGYVFTECVDPIWQGPMAWDVNFLEVSENFGYYGGDTDNHVRWDLVDAEGDNRGRVFDVTFNKENWNGSFRIVPAGRVLDADTSVDMSSYEGGNLVFDLRVVEPTDADIYVTAECIYPCEATPRQVLPATDGSWSTISIPLADFEGMDWSKTSIPLSIYPEWGAQTDVRFQVDNIRFESASCVEEENVIFDECLGPEWHTMAAVDSDTINESGEYLSGNTDNHVQWSEAFSGSPERGDILAVQFTNEATGGHFYVRTESRQSSNDMSAYINGALVFDINVQEYGSNTDGIVVRVDTWWDGETSDEILLPEVATGEWATIEIPVSDLLVGGGLDIADVLAGFSIWPAGDQRGDQKGVEILLDNIRWEMQLSE